MAATTTTSTTGLAVQAVYNPNWYPTGVTIRNTDYPTIPIKTHDWHGEWN